MPAVRRIVKLILSSGCSWLVLSGSAKALPVDPQPLPFYFQLGAKVVSGSISIMATDHRTLRLQIEVDSFRFKVLRIHVFDGSQQLARSPTGATALDGPGVDIQQIGIQADSVEIRFHNFRPPFASTSDPFFIRYAEELLPGDQLVLTLRKGETRKTITARVVPEPSTALLLSLGLALLAGAARGRTR